MSSTVHRFLALVVVACTSFTALAACSSDSGPVKAKPVLDLSKDGVGTCLLVGTSIDAEVSKLPTIDCALEHTHEIYATIVVSDTKYPVYPGTEALDAVAQHDCTAAFQPYVGSVPFDSALFFSWLLPTLASWNDHKDRTILCVTSRFDNAKLKGTVKGSRL